MSLQLPDAVETYFAISNGGDVSRLASCFCADATVFDENKTHEGIESIKSWQHEAQQAFTYHVQPLEALHEEGRLTVIARITGNFPGSPVKLSHVFVLKDDRIRSLEITP
ncbi:nuclear transport factor 2 family protein [Phytopseudomonas daroniae]|uniref:nuclear transport factor 2 family protein n=1 Tax=Phytopseudomonas daroniae TaxID=2487519 RepID=UPI0010385543|nr:nuclear transport factor 2 family protein [Pseudomonas daroniae]TBU73259.1 polyketide cyclase [Pseudomonas daroniae]